MGAAVALPLLDGMIPALSAFSSTPAKPVVRFGVVYAPNGMVMPNWTPARVGSGFEFSPILSPLEPFRKDVLVLTGLDCRTGEALGDGAGDHSRASASFLTGVHPKKTEGADIQCGISIDQVVARELGKETQLASLELASQHLELLGTCDTGYSCAYQNSISWRSATTPLPMIGDPRAIFERLFGDTSSTDPRVRLAQIRENGSLLDGIRQRVAELQRDLGPRDRLKLSEYLEAIRDVERRIQLAEAQNSRELPLVEQPAGIPPTFAEHIQLMFDLEVLALQCDLTRVVTFMIGKETSETVYPETGIREGHHPLTHHGGDPDKVAKATAVAKYHVSKFAYLLERLRSTPDGEGSLLDHSMIIYGSGLSDGNLHDHVNLPVVVVGSGAGRLHGNRHVVFEGETPVTNLYLSLLDKLNIPLDNLGDSTGRVRLLSEVA
jgi:hypothetical protein